MKIAIFDNAAGKFSLPLVNYWREKGHEVLFEMGSNPIASGWADLIYFDWMDNNFYFFLNGEDGTQEHPYPKKRIAVRMIDIDYHQHRHESPKVWSYLDDMIVINKFYFDKVKEETTPYSDNKLHMISMGVDLNKFTLKDNRERGYKIACVTGNIWEAKSGYEAIRIFQEVCRLYPGKPWELFIRGQYFPPTWREWSYEHLIDVSGLRDQIHIVPQMGELEMPIWYRSMDYTLVTSHKEAFSFAAAEGMACGLKPIINNFFGSDDVWDKKYKFNSINEAAIMIGEGAYEPSEYRAYIEQNYDIKKMFSAYDQLFGT